MERVCPVLRSSRVMLPFCESTYRIDESLGAGTAYSPSPPVTVNHSEPFKPPEPPPPPPPPTLVDGPHQALLSWRPPHNMYGVVVLPPSSERSNKYEEKNTLRSSCGDTCMSEK